MLAVVFEGPNAAVYREIETPSPRAGEVLVRSLRAGVCRTDLEMLRGELDPRLFRFPLVPGHEWSGEVAELGAGVDNLALGERVVCEGNVGCRHCRRCQTGTSHLCENPDAIGFTRDGGYGEYVVVPRHLVHRLPGSLSLDAAVLVEPAACVLRGLERARPEAGERVAVVGIGTLGSLALLLAQCFSPAARVAYGIRREELELALQLGADEALDARRPAGNGSFDLVVETAGAPEAVELATRLVRRGGRVVLLGVAGVGKTLTLPADRIVLGDIEIIGTCSYSSGSFGRVLGLLEQGLVEFDALVTHRFPAARFAEAFRLMDAREGIVAKIVLEH